MNTDDTSPIVLKTNALISETQSQSLAKKNIAIPYLFVWSCIFHLAITWIWFYIPDDFFSFAKTSLVGNSFIQFIYLIFVFILPFLYFIKNSYLKNQDILGTYPGIGILLLSLIAGAPAGLFLTSSHNLILRSWRLAGFKTIWPNFYFINLDNSNISVILSLLMGFLLPLLVHELVWRGMYYYIWLQKLNPFFVIFLSAFVSTIFIHDPLNFFPWFIFAAFLGFLRYATDNILAPLLIQIGSFLTLWLFNPILVRLDPNIDFRTLDSNKSDLYISVASMIISLACFIPLFLQFYKFLKGRLALIEFKAKLEGADSTAVSPSPSTQATTSPPALPIPNLGMERLVWCTCVFLLIINWILFVVVQIN